MAELHRHQSRAITFFVIMMEVQDQETTGERLDLGALPSCCWRPTPRLFESAVVN